MRVCPFSIPFVFSTVPTPLLPLASQTFCGCRVASGKEAPILPLSWTWHGIELIGVAFECKPCKWTLRALRPAPCALLLLLLLNPLPCPACCGARLSKVLDYYYVVQRTIGGMSPVDLSCQSPWQRVCLAVARAAMTLATWGSRADRADTMTAGILQTWHLRTVCLRRYLSVS